WPSAPATAAVAARSLPEPETATAAIRSADRGWPDGAPAPRSAHARAPSGTAAPRHPAELIPLRRLAARDPANSLSSTARPLQDHPPLPRPRRASALTGAQPPLHGRAAAPVLSTATPQSMPTLCAATTPAKPTETRHESEPGNPPPLRLTRAAGRLATVLADNLAGPASPAAPPSA